MIFMVLQFDAALRLIPDLIAQGYKLVTVSEMAAAKNVTLQPAKYAEFWQSALDAGYVPGYNGMALLRTLPQMELLMAVQMTAVWR